RVPGLAESAGCRLVALDGKGHGVASAEAERGDAALEVAALQYVEQRDEDARSRCANGVTESDRAAIDVDLFGIETKLARDRDSSDGEGFVEFDEIDVFVTVPAGFRQQLFDGVHRRHHHPLGFYAADRLGDDPSDGLLAEHLRF